MSEQTHTCHACGDVIDDGAPVPVTNQRTGNTWFSHPNDQCLTAPVPDSYAHTAREMARLCPVEGDPDFWDRWKDEMKDRDP